MQESQLAPIDAIQSVAKTLEDNQSQLSQVPDSKRSEIARWCAGLADAAQQIAEALNAGTRPEAGCRSLAEYHASSEEVLGGVLSDMTLRHLVQRLEAARDPKRYPEILAQADAAGEAVNTPTGRVVGGPAELAHLVEAADILWAVGRGLERGTTGV